MLRRTCKTVTLVAAIAATSLALPLSATATAPQPVTIAMTGMLAGPNSVVGSWSASGAISDSGSYVEQIRFAGRTVHVVFVLAGASGTITLEAQAVLVETSPTTLTFHAGHWKVVSGTGA